MKTILTAAICLVIFNSCGKDKPVTTANLISNSEAIELSIEGDYSDPYNSNHSINSENWVVSFNGDSSTYEIIEFNNEENYLIALNGDDSFNPGEYSRFEWTFEEGTLYYCQSVYDAETEEEAKSYLDSDPTDPSSAGCGSYNFPWTELSL
ncbi:MAG: hypothetical protein CME70_17455 [Halobacteriovorax sp.]|nr:hypothetical protein [Halobacteriovorax sp.]|tara:strand:- start:41140 stop:41592 length:453 start_codon:yes stop_codon:yes gene_type:complete